MTKKTLSESWFAVTLLPFFTSFFTSSPAAGRQLANPKLSVTTDRHVHIQYQHS